MSWKFDRSKSLAGKKFNPLSLLNPIWSNSPKPQNWLCRCPLLPWEHYTLFPFQKYRMSESEDHLLLFDLVMKMLAYDPVERVNLDEALRHPFFDNIPPQYRLEFRWIGKHKKHDDDDHPVFFFIQHGILKQKENRNKLLPTFHFSSSLFSWKRKQFISEQ